MITPKKHYLESINNNTRTPANVNNNLDKEISKLLYKSISGDLITNALEVEAKVEFRKNKEITTEQLKILTKKVAEIYKVTDKIAYVGICCTLQAGGSNNNKRSTVKICIQNIDFESKKINDLIQQQLKVTPRQLAKAIANDIFVLARKHQIIGNAYISLTRFYPQLLLNSDEYEKFWAADFQIDNVDCPEYIRNALLARYADKFTKSKKLDKH